MWRNSKTDRQRSEKNFKPQKKVFFFLFFFFFLVGTLYWSIYCPRRKCYKTDRFHVIVECTVLSLLGSLITSPTVSRLHSYSSDHLTSALSVNHSLQLSFIYSLSECCSVCVCVLREREWERGEKESLTLPTAASCHNCQVMMKHCCDRRQYSRYGREKGEKLFCLTLSYISQFYLPPLPLHTPLSAGNFHSDCPLSSWHPPSAGRSCSSPVAPCASGWPFSLTVLSPACTHKDKGKYNTINPKPCNIITVDSRS